MTDLIHRPRKMHDIDFNIPASYRDGLKMIRLKQKSTVLNHIISIGRILKFKKTDKYVDEDSKLDLRTIVSNSNTSYHIFIEDKEVFYSHLTKDDMLVNIFQRGTWELRLQQLEQEIVEWEKGKKKSKQRNLQLQVD